MNKTQAGTVYWLTGLAGSGKTTIGHLFYQSLKHIKPNTAYLDGDVLRWVFGNNTNFSLVERLQLAGSYGRLCKALSDQGLDVVCTTISMFWEIQDWNRENLPHYQEIYVRVPMDVLVKRDQKNIYSKALRGEMKNVIGINAPFEEPKSPDVVIDNDGTKTPEEIVEVLMKTMNR